MTVQVFRGGNSTACCYGDLKKHDVMMLNAANRVCVVNLI